MNSSIDTEPAPLGLIFACGSRPFIFDALNYAVYLVVVTARSAHCEGAVDGRMKPKFWGSWRARPLRINESGRQLLSCTSELHPRNHHHANNTSSATQASDSGGMGLPLFPEAIETIERKSVICS